MKPTLRWMLTAGVVAIGLTTWNISAAKAQGPGFGVYNHGGYWQTGGYNAYGGGGYGSPRGLVYHPPSVHYDRVYHPTVTHWTPFRGVHTHGHFDIVPHYTPGHFDTRHGRHIHPNPYYHHR